MDGRTGQTANPTRLISLNGKECNKNFFKHIQHHEDRRYAGVRKTESYSKQYLIQMINLLQLLIPLCNRIMVHNTIAQRQFFLPAEHHILDAAK